MPNRLSFPNPNFESAANYSLDVELEDSSVDFAEGETGIAAIDAGRKIYNMIMTARAEAEKYKQEAITCRESSFVDVLTSCYNRNFFEKYKAENFDRERDHNKLALIFADLNNLKFINDTVGHEAGDSMIKYTADYLKNNYRPGDLVIRLGGDEFLVICRNDGGSSSNFEEAIDINRRNEASLPTECSTSSLVYNPDQNYRPDLAFGIAVYDKYIDKDLEDTLTRADRSMYSDKIHQKSTRQNGAVVDTDESRFSLDEGR